MSTRNEQTSVAKQLAGDEPIPTSQLGAVVRFIQLSDDEVEKATLNGDAGFAAEMLSTSVESLVTRRNRALGRSTTATDVVPAITRLAKLADEAYQKSVDAGRIDFLARLWGVAPAELSRRRAAQRLRLGLAKTPAKALATKVGPKAKASAKRRGKADEATRPQ
jgi:hypothetical protein